MTKGTVLVHYDAKFRNIVKMKQSQMIAKVTLAALKLTLYIM